MTIQQQNSASMAEIMHDGERGSLRFERQLHTSLADAWAAVTDPERIARWFAPVSVEEGSWSTYWDDGAEYARGQILRCEPPSQLELSWRASDDVDPAGAESTVRLTLSETGGGVLLVLEHEGLVPGDMVLYGAGWHTFLQRLPDGDPAVDWGTRFTELKPQYEQAVRPAAGTT